MEMIRQIAAIIIGALVSTTYVGNGDEWFIPDFKDGSFEYEYTLLDLDEDGENEMIVQMKDEPQGYSAVFNKDNGKVYCWRSDSVEMNCFDYPLDNGTMVNEYDYNGSVTYYIYRFDTDGDTTDTCYMYIREEPAFNDDTVKYPVYEIDDREVTKEEFEKERKELIYDHQLDRSLWIPIN